MDHEVTNWSDWEDQLQQKATDARRNEEILSEWKRGPLLSWVDYANAALADGYGDWKEAG